MSNIFNITEERLRLINEIEAVEGEFTEEMESAWTINAEEAKSKLDDYCYVLKLKESEIQLAKDEIDSYKTKIAARENTIKRLKETMLTAVQLFGSDGKPNKEGRTNKVFETEHHKLYTQTAKKLVNEDNESITIDNFDDDRYNRYSIERKLTIEEVEAVRVTLKLLYNEEEIDLKVKRDVDTTKLKDDLLSMRILSRAQHEELTEEDIKLGITSEQLEDTLVDAYIVLNDTIRIK